MGIHTEIAQFGGYAQRGLRMDWLGWIVLIALAVASVLWLVRRFRTENRRLDGMISDFDRKNPRREPGSPSPARRLAGIRRRR